MPGTVTHTVIPTTWEAELWGSEFKASPGKKLGKAYPKKRASCGGTCLIPATWRQR
jgi:hypothetical protein